MDMYCSEVNYKVNSKHSILSLTSLKTALLTEDTMLNSGIFF